MAMALWSSGLQFATPMASFVEPAAPESPHCSHMRYMFIRVFHCGLRSKIWALSKRNASNSSPMRGSWTFRSGDKFQKFSFWHAIDYIYIYHLAHVKGAKDALQCYGQEIFCRRRGKIVYTFDNPFGLKLLCVLNPIHGARHASCTSSEVLRSGWFSYQEAPWLISSMPTLNLKYFPGFPLVFILGFSSWRSGFALTKCAFNLNGNSQHRAKIAVPQPFSRQASRS